MIWDDDKTADPSDPPEFVSKRAEAEGVPIDEILMRGPLFLSALAEGREYTGN